MIRMMLWVLALVSVGFPAGAWENHALLTAIAVANMKEITEAKQVEVESLDAFLKAEQQHLVKFLDDEEKWARENIKGYAPLPAVLTFGRSCNSKSLRLNFLAAIRVNPESPFALFLQELPGHKRKGANYLAPTAVTLMPNSLAVTSRNFIKLQPGQRVAPADVFISASDEPDYGLDVNLWTDSGTKFGQQYQFGEQPYGKSDLEYASQAPFHMGFFHEWTILNWAANELTGAHVEYRIHQFFALSRFAFQQGHPYWGWRFAGLGVHYIQDLTQPFHAAVLPGENTLYLLSSSLLDSLGMQGPKAKLAKQASDEHLAIEDYVYRAVLHSITANTADDIVVRALKPRASEKHFHYSANYVREILTAQSHTFAERVAEVMRPLVKSPRTNTFFAQLMENFGEHTRSWVRSVTLL